MNAVDRALWFIESHFAGPLSLQAVAEASGMSRFHLSRVFGHATGHSVLGYVRGRRLSEAARRLAAGAPDILPVALEAGYSSHEAFTRAFRDHFGLSPEEVRERGETATLNLVEPLRMHQTSTAAGIEPLSIEDKPVMLIAGLQDRLRYEETAKIPAQWQRFQPHIGTLQGEVGRTAYGVCLPQEADSFDYLCGVEVTVADDLPEGLTSVRIPPLTYAVFQHRGHVSAIQATCAAIFGEWLPRSGISLADNGPSLVEVYGPRFDPHSGLGGVEIWVPVAK